MNANRRESVEIDLGYEVVGCAMAVINAPGHGLREKTYERALCVEFESREFLFKEQHLYPVYYRGRPIDDYAPDLEVEHRLIFEVKTVDEICDKHLGQMFNYLKITGLEAGLILDFKHPRLEWQKVVLQKNSALQICVSLRQFAV